MTKFAGTWHIAEMENWDEDYFNMEEIVKEQSGEKLEFTWEGGDENDEASGSGWLRLKDKDTLEGKIKFHQGDGSLFLAKRA